LSGPAVKPPHGGRRPLRCKGRARLENAPVSAPNRASAVVGAYMFRRLVLLGGVVAIGLALGGCTRCGPIWDDWMQPKSCKSDHL